MMQPSEPTGFNFAALEASLQAARTPDELHAAVVDSAFRAPEQAALLFLGIVVLLLVNPRHHTIDRVALSKTSHATATKQVSAKRFEDIKIPLEATENLIAQVIQRQEPAGTADWATLFVPELTDEQARINQANGGIGYSMVYPVNGPSQRGAMIFSYFAYAENITRQQQDFMKRYTDLVSRYLG